MEKAIGKTIVWVVKLILALFMQGFVASTMWNWLITEIFNVKYLSLVEGLALSIFIRMFFKEFDGDKPSKTWTEIVVIYATMLFLSFIAHLLLRLS